VLRNCSESCGALHTVAQRGRGAMAKGIDRCQNQQRNRRIGRNLESVTAGFVSVVFENRVVEA